MSIIKQYFKILSVALTGLAFAFASFYLFLNLYHSSEIKRVHYVDFSTSSSTVELNNTLSNVRSNLNKLNGNNKLSLADTNDLKNKINICLNSFSNETYSSLENKGYVNIKDVYHLLLSLNNDVLSPCIVDQLYPLVTEESDFFKNDKELIKSYMDLLLQEGSYLEKDLLNNSSYYFNTDMIALTVKNNTKDGFNEVISSYIKVAKFLESLTNMYIESGVR